MRPAAPFFSEHRFGVEYPLSLLRSYIGLGQAER